MKIEERLTPVHGWMNASYDTWELCGLDHVCKRDCWEPAPCKIPKMLYRLAEYESTGLSPSEIEALKEKQIPKEPIEESSFGVYCCPACGRILIGRIEASKRVEIKHCNECGQAIKWIK